MSIPEKSLTCFDFLCFINYFIPKTSSGSDLMSGAPSAVSLGQLKEVSLRLM